MARWTLVIDDKIDQHLRAFLGQQGANKGALAKFVEQAVRERIFSETAKTVKNRNAAMDQQLIMHSIEDAVEAVRADRS